MPETPHVLVLTQCLPYPPHSGVMARTYNILKQLRTDFRVTLLAFSRVTHQPDEGARQTSERLLGDVVHRVEPAIPIPGDVSRVRRVWDHVRSVVTGRPYAFYTYGSGRFRSQLRQLLARDAFDLIHLDSLDLYRWVPELPPAPLTCTHHSIESELLRRHAQWVRPRALGLYLAHQADLLERVERTLCPRFAANLMMSETEAARLQTLAPGSRTVAVPNGVDVNYFTPRPDVPAVPGRVVFVGDASTFPNRDAVDHLLRAVWPAVRRARSEASLTLVGRGTEAALARSPAPGVIALGRVPDVRPHLASAECCVVPLRVGGGTRLKILDAWAMGKAVVSTSVGCEGLEAVDGENILVRDDPQTLAAAVGDVLQNETLRARLGSNGRASAERTYSWESVGRGLRAAYRVILDSQTGCSSHALSAPAAPQSLPMARWS